MSDEHQQQLQHYSCCRLCLAPDNECISILNSYAADKEPLVTKIHSCVSIKISNSDCLSLSICHACISYLNSWQSFKNRCLAAQIKQRSWLDSHPNKLSTERNNSSDHHYDMQYQHDQQIQLSNTEEASALGVGAGLPSSILEGISSLKKRKSLTVYPLPAVHIKDEPIDADDEYNIGKQHDESDELVDPTMFLERTTAEGDEPLMESNHYGGGNITSYENEQQGMEMNSLQSAAKTDNNKEASCRACNLKFSTRANARRHERNLHPNLFDSLGPVNNIPLSKQTAALNASLELQRAVAAAVAADVSKLNNSGVISTQKYRQEVVNAFNNCEMGGFDYDNPDKYKHLLTDEKIVFLQQNEEFLQQYQEMTCRCCNKFYTTYKNFMAHMRKKYLTLPRNLCFNCLKLNDSKALFISHLKRRNCINLYKVLHNLMTKNANFAAAVTATVAATSERIRAKELLVNKIYECKLCSKTFRLNLEFRSHIYEAHADAQRKNLSNKQCGFCAVSIEDLAARKHHYNSMECMMVLCCVTCDTKHATYQNLMEHVQEKHLPSFNEHNQMFGIANNSPGKKSSIGGSSADESRTGQLNTNLNSSNFAQQPAKTQYFSRMPQACPICGQQYNNYNNVLRHMESKHPDQLPQTYKCVKCGIGYPRLSNLRDHMVNAHHADKARHTGFDYIVNAETVKPAANVNKTVYTGRYDYVMKDLLSITNGGVAVDDEDYDNDTRNVKRMRLDNGISPPPNGQKECPICKALFNNNIGLSNHMRSHQLQNPLTHTGAKTNNNKPQIPQNILKRTLEQAAERRFRRMRCRICQRRFSTKKSYRYHMLNDHQIRNVQFIKCQLCDAEFAYEKGLKVHMFKVHNTLLKDEMIIKQYECEICSIVYRTDVELQHHLANVHNKFGPTPANDELEGTAKKKHEENNKHVDNNNTPLYWYQCKYCPSNFNTNKKLAIHINSHDEFDSNDYSCKDCGNVYSGRKSLWVHRYKKHPQIAQPSECEMCKKVFFDSQMLNHHLPSCNRKQVNTAAMADPNPVVYKHKTGDDDDDENDGSSHDVEKNPIMNKDLPNLKIKLPEVACTICGARFTDQELFTKHIQMHELELYTDNPLAAMFDTGPADPNQFYMDRLNENGEYACDLCLKTFTQMTALKVHRKWHFRGDSKQNDADQHSSNSISNHQTTSLSSHQRLLGLEAVGLMPRQAVTTSSKSQKRKRELKCKYCPSTFISNNNLRRHLYELHKNEIGNLPVPPKIELDKMNHCRRCDLQFETKFEWIEHKVSDARVMKPFGPFQWGCDLCGMYVSRKEKLINHIHNHLKESTIVPVSPKDSHQQMLRHKQQQQRRQQQKQKEKEQQNNQQQQQQQQHMQSANAHFDGKSNSHSSASPIQQEESSDSAKVPYDDYNDEIEDEVDESEYEQLDGNSAPVPEEFEDDLNMDEEEITSSADNKQTIVHEDDENDNDDDDDDGDEDDDDDDDNGENDQDEEEEDEDIANDEDGDNENNDAEEIADADEDEDEDSNDNTNPSASNLPDNTADGMEVAAYEDENEDDEGDEDEDDDDDDEVDQDIIEESEDEFDDYADEDSSNDNRRSVALANAAVVKSRFSCDLCQVFFDSQQELQKHVKMHFLNGPGSVTLTEIKSKSLSSSKSRSSSSDIVTVSSA